MLKRLVLALSMVLTVTVCAAIFVTVWLKNGAGNVPASKPEQTTREEQTVEEQSTLEEFSDYWDEPSTFEELSTSDEPETEEDLAPPSQTFVASEEFKVKLKTRKFSRQNGLIKQYKTFFDKTYDKNRADVFLYDLTHDGDADMLVVTPVYNDAGNKTVGAIVQLYTVTDGSVMTELFRDYGGFTHSGGNFCCYITEKNGEDCLLIAKDDLWGGEGTLSFSVFYCTDSGSVITYTSSQYAADETTDSESEYALNRYSQRLEEELAAAHTTIVDYRSPYAVTSHADDVFAPYVKK